MKLDLGLASAAITLLVLNPWPCAGAQDTIPKPPPPPFPIIIIAPPDSTCPARPDTIPTPPVSCPKPMNTSTAGSGGLQHVNFYTRHGVIEFIIPVDILPGDTVSATVLAHPSGITEIQKSLNLTKLQDLSVRIGDAQISSRTGITSFSLAVPPGTPGLLVDLVDPLNRVLQTMGIGFQAADSDLATKPRVFGASSLGAAGQELLIEGNFDGNTNTTQVLFNGVPGEILGETPHGLTVAIPRDQIGPTKILVRESGKTAIADDFSSARINMTVEDSLISVGKMTRVQVEVELGERFGSPFGIVVSNRSLSVLELIGGNEQFFPLEPAPDGRATFTLLVRGKRVGTGSLKADFATFSVAHFIPHG